MEVLNENKLSILRKYFFESVLIALSVCVVTLFYLYIDLNKYVRNNLTNEVVNSRLIIQDNTQALNETKSLINKSK